MTMKVSGLEVTTGKRGRRHLSSTADRTAGILTSSPEVRGLLLFLRLLTCYYWNSFHLALFGVHIYGLDKVLRRRTGWNMEYGRLLHVIYSITTRLKQKMNSRTEVQRKVNNRDSSC